MNNHTVVQKFRRLCDIPRDGGITYLRMSSPQTRPLMVGAAKFTDGVHNVNASAMRSLTLALPLPAEQREIIVRAQRLLLWIEALGLRFWRAKRAVDHLTPTTLVKTDRGEFVPQNSADEPADKLPRTRAKRVAPAADASQRKVRQRTKSSPQPNTRTT